VYAGSIVSSASWLAVAATYCHSVKAEPGNERPQALGADLELDRRARAVGLVAIRASRVEHVAAVLAVILIGTPRTAPMLLGSGWSHIRQALNQLLDELIEEATDDAERRQFDLPIYRQVVALLKRADRLMAQRGNVVHALWDASNNSSTIVAMTIKRWGKESLKEWSLDELDGLQRQLLEVDHQLGKLIDRVSGP
jgi:hypothetical protein